MKCKRHELYEAYVKLLRISYRCNDLIQDECDLKGLTKNQIKYLRIIDSNERMTFGELANTTENSKPTITEVINKFLASNYVFKEKSPVDKRVYYIYLTDKGKQIARVEERMQLKLIEHIQERLTEEELKTFIYLLNKIT